jgi:hypothetical protein
VIGDACPAVVGDVRAGANSAPDFSFSGSVRFEQRACGEKEQGSVDAHEIQDGGDPAGLEGPALHENLDGLRAGRPESVDRLLTDGECSQSVAKKPTRQAIAAIRRTSMTILSSPALP